MPYYAAVINVMIASPSDVQTELTVAREIIGAWNQVNSQHHKIVLMPLHWSTHSTPTMSDSAQAAINKQVLANADVLIAVFWTRIGSPTQNFESGTIEEIQEHIASGKPALLYFSSMPVRLESVDAEQYAALQRFKNQCKSIGLLETYDTIPEFSNKLSRHIAAVVNQIQGNPYSAPNIAKPPIRLPDSWPGMSTIKSPMVGTFYVSSSPDALPFVEAGSEINEETTICVIEAMKIFNEVPAEVRGQIVEVLVGNGQPVEFGQPLFRYLEKKDDLRARDKTLIR
jgi:acetyl-CoA carboxylase biotin carboxyl carrier protein